MIHLLTQDTMLAASLRDLGIFKRHASMNEMSAPSVEQDQYWLEMQQLRLSAIYVQRYRDSIARMETTVAAIRAITSSGSIGAWVIWRQYAFVWAALIAISQIADALRDVFPFRKRRQALSGWCNALNRLFVDAQRDWDSIASGILSNPKIANLTHQLRQKNATLRGNLYTRWVAEETGSLRHSSNRNGRILPKTLLYH
jgi:hypothetical protein